MCSPKSSNIESDAHIFFSPLLSSINDFSCSIFPLEWTDKWKRRKEKEFSRVCLAKAVVVAAKKNSYSFLSHRTNIHNRLVLNCVAFGSREFSLFLSLTHSVRLLECMQRKKSWLFIHSQLSLRKLRIFVECTSACVVVRSRQITAFCKFFQS